MNSMIIQWENNFDYIFGGKNMPKDSQVDKKSIRKKKANGQTPLTKENQNQNRNNKKQSNKNNDV